MTDRHRSSPDLDNQLKKYLDEVQRERASGYTIEGLYRDFNDFKLEQNERNRQIDELESEHRALRIRVDRHGRDIRDIKAHIWQRDPVEFDTGVHQVEDLRRHLALKEAELSEGKKKVEEDRTWWQRKKVEWLAAVIGASVAIVLGGAGTIIWYLLIHATEK